MKIAWIYGTCGINGADNSYYYIPALESIINQQDVDVDVYNVDCLCPLTCRESIDKKLSSKINRVLVNTPISFPHTINKAWDKIKLMADYDMVVITDSGIKLPEDPLFLKRWIDSYKAVESNCGILMFPTDTDMEHRVPKITGEYTEIPVGYHLGLHVVGFTKEYIQNYKRLLFDTLAYGTPEPAIIFATYAINKKAYMPSNFIFHHINLDGGSQHVHGGASYYPPPPFPVEGGKEVNVDGLWSKIPGIRFPGMFLDIDFDIFNKVSKLEIKNIFNENFFISDELYDREDLEIIVIERIK